MELPYDIPFQGFGTGNINNIAYTLNCLGFSHIGTIFDGDKEEDYKTFLIEYTPKVIKHG